jgi:hypothetical protein
VVATVHSSTSASAGPPDLQLIGGGPFRQPGTRRRRRPRAACRLRCQAHLRAERGGIAHVVTAVRVDLPPPGRHLPNGHRSRRWRRGGCDGTGVRRRRPLRDRRVDHAGRAVGEHNLPTIMVAERLAAEVAVGATGSGYVWPPSPSGLRSAGEWVIPAERR